MNRLTFRGVFTALLCVLALSSVVISAEQNSNVVVVPASDLHEEYKPTQTKTTTTAPAQAQAPAQAPAMTLSKDDGKMQPISALTTENEDDSSNDINNSNSSAKEADVGEDMSNEETARKFEEDDVNSASVSEGEDLQASQEEQNNQQQAESDASSLEENNNNNNNNKESENESTNLEESNNDSSDTSENKNDKDNANNNLEESNNDNNNNNNNDDDNEERTETNKFEEEDYNNSQNEADNDKVANNNSNDDDDDDHVDDKLEESKKLPQISSKKLPQISSKKDSTQQQKQTQESGLRLSQVVSSSVPTRVEQSSDEKQAEKEKDSEEDLFQDAVASKHLEEVESANSDDNGNIENESAQQDDPYKNLDDSDLPFENISSDSTDHLSQANEIETKSESSRNTNSLDDAAALESNAGEEDSRAFSKENESNDAEEIPSLSKALKEAQQKAQELEDAIFASDSDPHVNEELLLELGEGVKDVPVSSSENRLRSLLTGLLQPGIEVDPKHSAQGSRLLRASSTENLLWAPSDTDTMTVDSDNLLTSKPQDILHVQEALNAQQGVKAILESHDAPPTHSESNILIGSTLPPVASAAKPTTELEPSKAIQEIKLSKNNPEPKSVVAVQTVGADGSIEKLATKATETANSLGALVQTEVGKSLFPRSRKTPTPQKKNHVVPSPNFEDSAFPFHASRSEPSIRLPVPTAKAQHNLTAVISSNKQNPINPDEQIVFPERFKNRHVDLEALKQAALEGMPIRSHPQQQQQTQSQQQQQQHTPAVVTAQVKSNVPIIHSTTSPSPSALPSPSASVPEISSQIQNNGNESDEIENDQEPSSVIDDPELRKVIEAENREIASLHLDEDQTAQQPETALQPHGFLTQNMQLASNNNNNNNNYNNNNNVNSFTFGNSNNNAYSGFNNVYNNNQMAFGGFPSGTQSFGGLMF